MDRSNTATRESEGQFGLSPSLSPEGTIAGAIRRRAGLYPDHPAIVSTAFAPLSYRELQCQIDEIRTALRFAGFSRNARVAIAIPDGPKAALAIVAVACSAVSIPLDPRQTLNEIETCLAALRPDVLLIVKGAHSAARRAAESNGIAIIELAQSEDGTVGFKVGECKSDITAASDEFDDLDPDAPAFILQTSGTAGQPKFIPVSHRIMLVSATRAQAWYNLTSKDCCLCVSPVFYGHGLKVTVFTPLLTGGSIAFVTDVSKFDYSEWFSILKPTWFSASPTLCRLIFDQTRARADAKLEHSLRFIRVSGAPLPRDLLEGLQHNLGVPVLDCYGATEASLISSNEPPPGRSKLGTCGIPWKNTVIIVGDDGRPLPQGERGEIMVGGASVISGYLNAPELNRARFVNGWFKTGDIGSSRRGWFPYDLRSHERLYQ